MKLFLLLILIMSSIFADSIFPIKKIGVIDSTWSESDKTVYETCIKGHSYYVLEAGYRSGLAPVWEEIDHPILGKIDQPKKCQ